MNLQEYFITCHVEYCQNHKLELNNASVLKYREIRKRVMHRHFFFFKNALQALFMEVEWQLRVKNGSYDTKRALLVVKDYLEMYELLPDYVKKLLQNERDDFTKLLNLDVLDDRIGQFRQVQPKRLGGK